MKTNVYLLTPKLLSVLATQTSLVTWTNLKTNNFVQVKLSGIEYL
jgi:hypothetical protein